MLSALAAGASAVANMGGAWAANRSRKREAARNRQFQERMRNTSWQAAVADMEAAGINPALAYSQGGAASPGGSMAAQENIAAGAVSSAMQAKRLSEELGLIRSQKAATTQSGIKTQREARYQEMMNKLWGTYTGPNNDQFVAGPLWEMHEANAASAKELVRMRKYENTLLKNMASVAGTPAGQKLAIVRYLMQSWKGR